MKIVVKNSEIVISKYSEPRFARQTDWGKAVNNHVSDLVANMDIADGDVVDVYFKVIDKTVRSTLFYNPELNRMFKMSSISDPDDTGVDLAYYYFHYAYNQRIQSSFYNASAHFQHPYNGDVIKILREASGSSNVSECHVVGEDADVVYQDGIYPFIFLYTNKVLLKEIKITRSGEVVTDIVPGFDNYGVPCLYDKAIGSLYYSESNNLQCFNDE